MVLVTLQPPLVVQEKPHGNHAKRVSRTVLPNAFSQIHLNFYIVRIRWF